MRRVVGKGYEIKRKTSSTRSSLRKCGKASEVVNRNGVEDVRVFLNRGCGIEEVWKSGSRGGFSAPGFPRLPQGYRKGL